MLVSGRVSIRTVFREGTARHNNGNKTDNDTLQRYAAKQMQGPESALPPKLVEGVDVGPHVVHVVAVRRVVRAGPVLGPERERER